MDLFTLQLIYHHGPLSRALVLRVLLLSAAVAVLPFLSRDPPLDPDSPDARCGGAGAAYSPPSSSITPEIIDSALLDLLADGYLPLGGRFLCHGPSAAAASAAMGRLGFPHYQVAVSVPSEPCGSGDLPFGSASFDFVFSAGGLDGARAPALVAMEMERVLTPGCAGAVLLAAGPLERPRSLVRTAAPVAAMLRASDVVAVRTVNSSAVVVVFRKKWPPAD